MTRINWNDENLYHIGVDRGVIYSATEYGSPGRPWNGLTSITEDASGGSTDTVHIDGVLVRRARPTNSDYQATITSLDDPKFASHDIIHLSWRTHTGSSVNPDHSHQIHLVYNANLTSSTKSYQSISANTTNTPFSFKMEAIPVQTDSGYYSAHFVIDPNNVYPWVMEQLLDIIYGNEIDDPRFPTIEELTDIFENGSILKIYDNGDGTWTADGPSEYITMLDSTTFEITSPSAIFLSSDRYSIQSY